MSDPNQAPVDPENPEGGEPVEGQNPEGQPGEDGPKPDDVPKVDPEQLECEKKIKENLSQISKTYDNSSFAYVNLNISEKELKKLYDLLKDYPYLRYINVSKNEIEDIDCIGNIPYLLTLNASNNLIKDMKIFSDPNKIN